MVPLYRGLPLFGGQCIVISSSAPRDGTMYATFGANGLEPNNDGGGRGGITVITGTLYGPGPGGLAASESAVRSFNDGQAGDFVDSLGTTWPNVLIQTFSPLGRVRMDRTGTCYRQFKCTLLHLS